MWGPLAAQQALAFQGFQPQEVVSAAVTLTVR
jgi:hypothetical protein